MSHACPFFRANDGGPLICETDCAESQATCRNRAEPGALQLLSVSPPCRHATARSLTELSDETQRRIARGVKKFGLDPQSENRA